MNKCSYCGKNTKNKELICEKCGIELIFINKEKPLNETLDGLIDRISDGLTPIDDELDYEEEDYE